MSLRGANHCRKTLPLPLCPGRLRSQRINALRIASEYLPAAIPLWVVMPEEKTTSYLVKMRFPEDHSSNGASIAWVDQFSGKVLGAWNSRTAPLGRRIERTNRDIHSGDIWGYPGRALACLMSMALVIQSTTGPYLWWKRRHAERTGRVKTIPKS